MCLHPPFYLMFYVFLGGPEEYRWRGGSRDAQGHFRRPAEWGRDGQGYGGGWRRRHLPGEKHCLQLGRTDIQMKYSVSMCIFCIVIVRWKSCRSCFGECQFIFGLNDYGETGEFDQLCTLILLACVSFSGISSAHMVCLVTESTHSPALSPPTLSPNKWPTSGPSSSLRASLSRHQTLLPWCPLPNFSPQLQQKATRTTTPLQSEY